MKEIRTRFAPSPTGFLHIGGLRTALYSYAFAKNKKGSFILRIEDTDRNRYVPGATEKVYEILKIFGLSWDEGPLVNGPFAPYVQSERVKTGVYQKYAEKLVDEGHAYYCFCPAKAKEEIEETHRRKIIELRDPCRNLSLSQAREKINSGLKPAIRLRVPENETISYRDFVVGKEIAWNSKDIDEVMLLKSDGFPTYHLGVVVDDTEMKITHILRGHDWLPSTPVHLLLYKYFEATLPEIGHLTDILDPQGGKLSKRKGSVACEEFLAGGYLPEAILNFIMLLGWAPKDNRELFTLEEFVEFFDKGDLQTANPIFNREKLDWFNGMYIRKTENAKLTNQIFRFFGGKYTQDRIEKILPLVKDRMVKFSDFEILAAPLLGACPLIDKNCLPSVKKEHLEKTILVLDDLSSWELMEINEKLAALIKESGWKTGDFYMSLRVAVCGCKITPPINESLVVLGKEETLFRLNRALKTI